jgi:hypothetical protein
MNSGADDGRRDSEPTFADVMNGFSFDAGRSPKRRRWGRKQRAEEPTPEPVAEQQYDMPMPPQQALYPPPVGPVTTPIEAIADDSASEASAVRPYTWTRGRTKSGLDLAIETLVSTSQRGRDQMGLLQMEHRSIAEMCEQTKSVAEVAALMALPLGVARVLLGDMAGLGVVTVHQTASSAGSTPDLALMERVLSGLRRL